jgi:hypothetical protein
MNRQYSFQKAPRCSATSKRTRERCKAPAVRGWTVCRFHGARGGGPRGKRNGMYRHGLRRPRRRNVSDLRHSLPATTEAFRLDSCASLVLLTLPRRWSTFGALPSICSRIKPNTAC